MQLAYGDGSHNFSIGITDETYTTYVICAKPRDTSFPWAYTLTTKGASAGLGYFYSPSYYFSVSATINDNKISFSESWSKGVNNGVDISLSDIDVYVYGLK